MNQKKNEVEDLFPKNRNLAFILDGPLEAHELFT